MPLNLTNNIVIYSKDNLNKNIKEAFNKTFKSFLEYFEVNESKLTKKITATILDKQFYSIRSPLIIKNIIESITHQDLTEDFVIEAFNINQSTKIDVKNICGDIHKKYQFNFIYNKDYSHIYNHIFSSVLMFLHFEKIIHLPYNFKIQYTHKIVNGKKSRQDFLINQYPPILFACRNLDSENKDDEDSKIFTYSSKEKLVSLGSKLVLSLGWVDFKDPLINDMVEFRNNNLGVINPITPPYHYIIKLLSLKYPNDFKINLKQWENASRIDRKIHKAKKGSENIATMIREFKGLETFETNDISLEFFSVESLSLLKEKLPKYANTISLWETVEKSYLKKVRKESLSSIHQAIKHLNIYLFFILTSWYENNESKIKYPETPKGLKGNIFISRILDNPENMPPTLNDFLEKKIEKDSISKEYHYAILKNLSSFFDFINKFSDELEGCVGFTNSICDFDFPKLSRSIGTNKGLIPRNMFGLLIAYLEMIKTYNKIILEKIINDDLPYKDLENSFLNNNNTFIDTIMLQDVVGYIPILYWNKKMIVFKEIQNLLDCRNAKIKNKPAMKIPYPHLLNHVYTALQTGLRGNHIQWLDAEKFNCLDINKNTAFSKLYVNTDKAKNSSWSPIVNRKVLDTLENQLEWRSLIEQHSFNEKKYYNKNEKTKWEKFYPLFSYDSDGNPYSDTQYINFWLNIIVNFQNIVPLFGLEKVKLAKLLPPNIYVNELNIEQKLQDYGKKCKLKCDLRWTSDITPHSARVSVVSHYITALPADIIGQYITGQTEAVVHHYVKIDDNYLSDIETGQKEGLVKLAIENEYNNITGKVSSHPILADTQDSNFIKSLNIDKKETIKQYGCITISLKEDAKNGIDLILENSDIKMAFNKTEICPYNNNCPSEIVKELKGLRRCGICPFAIRSIDHLPAIAVKKRQVMELLEEIEQKLETSDKLTNEECNGLEDMRQSITEELIGWIMSEEILENNRKNLVNQETYIIKRPEILIQKLEQVKIKEGDIDYLLTRINDLQSFPQMDTPVVKAKIDLLRRQLLARLGNFKEAFDSKIPIDPAYECLGLLRETIKRFDLTKEKVLELLTPNQLSLSENTPLIGINHERE